MVATVMSTGKHSPTYLVDGQYMSEGIEKGMEKKGHWDRKGITFQQCPNQLSQIVH